MILLKLATGGLLGMIAVSALAQAPSLNDRESVRAGLENGNRDSLPRSNKASNIESSDARSNIAPTLPAPAAGPGATSVDYLRAARAALNAGHTGQAQQSLEMAETRALDGSGTPDQAKMPSSNQTVGNIRDALHALGSGDQTRAVHFIDVALGN